MSIMRRSLAGGQMLTKDEAPRIAANVLGWVQSFQKFLSRSGAISVYRTVWRRFGVDRSIIVAIWGLEFVLRRREGPLGSF
jgi:hypothetical protein